MAAEKYKSPVKHIAMLGSLPPLRALSSYCLELSHAMAGLMSVNFISFKKIYPPLFYPGGDLKDDDTFPEVNQDGLQVSRQLTWYNPVTWVSEGLFTKGELLHAQWWSLPLFFVTLVICGGFKLRKKPVVFTVHNVMDHEKSKLYRVVSNIIFKFGDHFIVHSRKNKEQMIDYYGIPEDKISRIPHGALDFHLESDADRDEVRHELGFGAKDKVILMFGAIRPYKGVDTAVSALALVREKIPDARLLVAGKLWENWEPYKGLIKSLNLAGSVATHLDYIPSGRVSRFFAVSDLVILPYHHFDSQSGAGAAAVSFRKPLIVSDVGGLPDLVDTPRQVVPPKDPQALAQAIIDSFENPEHLSAMTRGAEKVAQTLSWPAIADKTLSVYEKVLHL